jgi:hypothetical protein
MRVHDRREPSDSTHIEAPDEPVRIAPLRLTLDDENVTADGELIVGARIGDLARLQLEGCRLGMDAGLDEADDSVGAPGDHPHGDRIPARRRVDRIDPERGECRVHRALEHRHQVRLPLIKTRGRVPIGSGFDCTCSMLASPEMVARTITAVRRENNAADDAVLEEGDVVEALGALEPVWDELYPAEQARVLRLLIERIDAAPDGISLTLHAAGIRSLVAELADQEPPAPAASEPLLEAAE